MKFNLRSNSKSYSIVGRVAWFDVDDGCGKGKRRRRETQVMVEVDSEEDL